jgi:hypothetical protein
VIGTYRRPGPHLCAGAGNIALTKAVVSGALKGGASLVGGVDPGSLAEAASAVTSEVINYLEKEDAQSAVDTNVVDMRTKWQELWGVVWIPDSTCQ